MINHQVYPARKLVSVHFCPHQAREIGSTLLPSKQVKWSVKAKSSPNSMMYRGLTVGSLLYPINAEEHSPSSIFPLYMTCMTWCSGGQWQDAGRTSTVSSGTGRVFLSSCWYRAIGLPPTHRRRCLRFGNLSILWGHLGLSHFVKAYFLDSWTASMLAYFRLRMFLGKIIPYGALAPCHWALYPWGCTGVKREFWLNAIFFVRYANSEWNTNFACGIKETNVLSFGWRLRWRSLTKNLRSITCQTLRDALCPGLTCMFLYEDTIKLITNFSMNFPCLHSKIQFLFSFF